MTRKNILAFEKAFAEEWVNNGHNSTQAYLKIKPHVTTETAKVEGHKYLTRPNVEAHIAAIQKTVSIKHQITRESLIEEYNEIKKRNLGSDDRIVVLSMENQAKLLGLNAPIKSDNTNANIDVNKAVDDERIGDLRSALKELKGEEGSSE